MLLTITTTRRPATDLAVLLGKDPGRVERVELAWGAAHVFFPEAGEERCTAALLVEVDPLELAGSSPKRGPTGPLSLYVNDRPYVAGSTTSAAIGLVLSSALRGTSGEWEPADRALPLEARLPALSCRGGERAVRALFEPLGYEVEVGPLDPRPPESSATTVASVTLRREGRLAELLSHLRVLLPVLDHDEHDLVDLDEVAKLATRGEGWLAEHPAREAIVARYRRPKLARWALARRTTEDDLDARRVEAGDARERALERRIGLGERRREAVVAALRAAGAERVLDLGCGEGELVCALAEQGFERVVGADVSPRNLAIAAARLERLGPRARERASLLHASALYRDERFAGFDAICLLEVIEHVEPSRLEALARVVLEHAAPRVVIVTTPNREHDALLDDLPAVALRHPDHRFEWTRAELSAWAHAVGERFGYSVAIAPIGEEDPELGPPTHLVVLTRDEGGAP